MDGQPPARTRKPRSDRGKPKAPRAGPFILQVLTEGKDGKGLWDDVDRFPKYVAAAKYRMEQQIVGKSRIVRQHGREVVGVIQPKFVME